MDGHPSSTVWALFVPLAGEIDGGHGASPVAAGTSRTGRDATAWMALFSTGTPVPASKRATAVRDPGGRRQAADALQAFARSWAPT